VDWVSGMPWFRFYSEALSDRKLDWIVQDSGLPRLTVLGAWTALLAMANDSPERGRLLVGRGLGGAAIAHSIQFSVQAGGVGTPYTSFPTTTAYYHWLPHSGRTNRQDGSLYPFQSIYAVVCLAQVPLVLPPGCGRSRRTVFPAQL
jgi:hypothetical protein